MKLRRASKSDSRIRSLRLSDLTEINRIYQTYHENEFSLPSMANTVTSAIIEREGKTVGFGVVKLLAEAIMVLDLGQPRNYRIDALSLLLREAIRGCDEVGIGQIHVFVQNIALQRILEKHYGFKVAEGVALVRDIDNG